MQSVIRLPGRPLIPVDLEDIQFLRGLRLPWVKIAQYLGISRSTLYRRMEEEGISQDSKYSDINDADLDRMVTEIKQNYPNDGERLLTGHLAARGIIIPRAKLRASIHRVDPINTALRRSVTVRRRVYNVKGPNVLWHIDGNHKLIKWRFVIFGGIDGFSRTVVFLKCSNNNRANSMLAAFYEGVSNYGLPSRIRTDLGGENVDVWRFMIEEHSDLSAVITGASTHNQRIERLWRDVFRSVGVLFHDTFCKLEDDGYLDPLNEVDLFCLHFIFKPRINAALDSFTESWNNHSISSVNSMTPNQLFIQGALEQNMVPAVPNAPSSVTAGTQPTHHEHVTVPLLRFTPCSSLRRRLDSINPLQGGNYFDCDAYLQTTTVVGQHLRRGCSHCTS